MKEHHQTSSSREAPHRRYSALHRALDQGGDSDALWAELARVCVKIGNDNEALQASRQIKDYSERTLMQRWLKGQGLNEQAHTPLEPELQQSERLMRSGLREELSGAFRLMFEDHMPLTVMVCTLTFPLVVGLGGYLTQGADR